MDSDDNSLVIDEEETEATLSQITPTIGSDEMVDSVRSARFDFADDCDDSFFIATRQNPIIHTSSTPYPSSVWSTPRNPKAAGSTTPPLPSPLTTTTTTTPTKKSTPSTPAADGKHSKDKERNSEKRRSKDEKRKQSTLASSENHRAYHPTKKSHTIRLTKAMFKKKLLNITTPKHQFYNMRFYHRNGILAAQLPQVYPAPAQFPELTLTQLINWPDIKMFVLLDHLSFSREIKQNCDRDLLFSDNVLVKIDTAQRNVTETRYLQKVPTTKVHPMVSIGVFDEYVTSLMEAAPFYDVGRSKQADIEAFFQRIIDDVKSVPYTQVQTRITHSRFLNPHKYICVFNHGDAATGTSKVMLRETINPELNFQIKKCNFLINQIDTWYEELATYLEDVLLNRPNHIRDSLKERYKKCLVFKCERCNEVFEGAMWNYKLQDHIKQKHFVKKDWTCVKCLRKWDQFELLTMGWNHDCTTGN